MDEFLDRASQSVRRRASEWSARRYERTFGTDTNEFWLLDEHGLPTDDRVSYLPSDWAALKRAFERLDPGPDDVFIDIGSGKGRGLLVAGTFPFRRVIGLELSSELSAISERAIGHNRSRMKSERFEFVVGDVTEYVFPDDATIFYMFCPFVGDVFARFTEHLLAFADRADHDVRLVYNYPFQHSALLETGRVSVLDVASAVWPPRSKGLAEVVVTYRVLRTGEPVSHARLRGDAANWCAPYDPGFVVERGGGDVWFASPAWRARADSVL